MPPARLSPPDMNDSGTLPSEAEACIEFRPSNWFSAPPVRLNEVRESPLISYVGSVFWVGEPSSRPVIAYRVVWLALQKVLISVMVHDLGAKDFSSKLTQPRIDQTLYKVLWTQTCYAGRHLVNPLPTAKLCRAQANINMVLFNVSKFWPRTVSLALRTYRSLSFQSRSQGNNLP